MYMQTHRIRPPTQGCALYMHQMKTQGLQLALKTCRPECAVKCVSGFLKSLTLNITASFFNVSSKYSIFGSSPSPDLLHFSSLIQENYGIK